MIIMPVSGWAVMSMSTLAQRGTPSKRYDACKRAVVSISMLAQSGTPSKHASTAWHTFLAL